MKMCAVLPDLCTRRMFVSAQALLASFTLCGCGGGQALPGSVPLPVDATYNTSVRSAGYTITDLGPGHVAAINKSGQVLGSLSHAYLWTHGVRHYLGVLPGDKGGSAAFSLNDSGQALGLSYANRQIDVEAGRGPAHWFVWQNGVFTLVSVGSPSDQYAAVKINNRGQVLLRNNSSADPAAVLWQAGQVTEVVAIGKSGKQMHLASINNTGVIIGTGSDSPEQFTANPVPTRSYLVQNGQVTEVGFLPDRLNTVANFINDNQQIVGTGFPYNVDDPNLPPQPYVWQNGKMTALKALGGDFEISGLNNPGKLVGWIQDTSIARRYAFLYDLNSQTLVDLDAAVGKSAGWQLENATAINDKGQIIGEGQHNGQPRSYLLTPL